MRTLWLPIGLRKCDFSRSVHIFRMCIFCAYFWEIMLCIFLAAGSDGTAHKCPSSAGGRTNEVRDVVNWNGINMLPDLHAVSWIRTYFPVRLHIPPKICTFPTNLHKTYTEICTSRKSAHFAKSHPCDDNVLSNSAHRVTSEATETLFLFWKK